MTPFATSDPAWRLLEGGDPAPGDLMGITLVEHTLNDAATRSADAIRTLESIGSTVRTWSGPAATTFRSTAVEDLLSRLRDAHGAYEGASAALATYRSELTTHQAEAREIAARAAQVDAGSDPVLGPTTLLSVPSPGLASVQADRDELHRDAMASAHRCASAITAAVKPVKAYERSTLEKLGGGIVDVMDDVNRVLDDANKWISLVALVTMWIPVVGEITGTVAIASNVIVLSTSAVLVTQHRRTASDVADAAFDVVLDKVGMGAGDVVAQSKRAAEYGPLEAAATRSAASRRAAADGYDRSAQRYLNGDDPKRTVNAARQEARALAQRNKAELDDAAAQQHRDAIATDPRPLATIRNEAAEVRADPRGSLTAWRVGPGDPTRPWQDLEIQVQAAGTTKAWLPDDDTRPARACTPTGWRG